MLLPVLFGPLLPSATPADSAPGAYEAMEEITRDLGVPHSACSFFGEDREDFFKTGLGAQLMAMTARSQLTTQVAAALSPGSFPNRSRARAFEQSIDRLENSGTIDGFIFAELKRRAIPAAPLTTDAEFLRRVTLDLTGRIPTQEEVVAFLSDSSADKRPRAIERLLGTTQWADRWAMFFGDLYRNTIATSQVNRFVDGRDAFHLFLRDSLRQNKPYDQMAREILAAEGTGDGRTYPESYSSFEQFRSVTEDYRANPVKPTAAGYIIGGLTTGGPIQDTYDALAVATARDFLGISHMDCILCHDGAGHLNDLSVWGTSAKRQQGWQLSAFFSDVWLARPRRQDIPAGPDGQVPRARYWIVTQNPRRAEYRLGTTTGNRPARLVSDNGEQVATPRYPFGGGGVGSGESQRQALGRLVTADRQFARAIVNYVWAQFFGPGIVEPADQFDLARLDPANPPAAPWTLQPSHPELLEFLAQSFVENEFDLQWLMRQITNSETYQLSSRYDAAWNPAYERYFARHQVRRLSAEQIHDAVVLATGVTIPFPISPALGAVVFAMQFPDVQFTPAPIRGTAIHENTAALLDSFFRGDRDETTRSSETSILQPLNLMNNVMVTGRVQNSSSEGALAQILPQSDDVVVRALYLRTLARFPSPQELAAGVATLQNGDRGKGAEDLLWSLLNKMDFIFNY